jgi:hypothetical protein
MHLPRPIDFPDAYFLPHRYSVCSEVPTWQQPSTAVDPRPTNTSTSLSFAITGSSADC